ncbi:MAG: hypothetical protein ACJAQ6_002468 [Arenicella sp.]|jgi:hypothetical protein
MVKRSNYNDSASELAMCLIIQGEVHCPVTQHVEWIANKKVEVDAIIVISNGPCVARSVC